MSLSEMALAARRQSSDTLFLAADQAGAFAVPISEAKPQNILGDVELPNYDRSKLATGVMHFGVGGFHRSHQLWYIDALLRLNPDENYQWAYTGVGVLPHDAGMRDALAAQDYLYTIVAKSKVESVSKERVTVAGPIRDMLLAPESPGEVMKRLAAHSTKIFSLTITEFGYTVPTSHGDHALLELALRAAESPWAEADADPDKFLGATALGYIVAGLAARRASMAGGATILSCDNIPGNGDNARDKIIKRVEEHSQDLKEWVEFNCTFPNCMVDRITPITPTELIGELSEKHGLKDNWPVNCETFTQWVIEDKFVDGISGRPRWEDAGVQIVENVHPYELTKIRLLNVIHTTMVFPALLMGLEYIHEAAQHPLVKRYYTTIMEKELRPTLEVVEGIDNIDLDKYQEVLIHRFSNEIIADTLLRVAMDTSDKLSVQGVPATLDGFQCGANMKGMAFCVASWGHFIHRSVEAGHVLRDQKARIVEAAMEGKDINALLDIEFIFHELIFHQEWRKMVVHFYDSIHTVGIAAALEKMLDEYSDEFK